MHREAACISLDCFMIEAKRAHALSIIEESIKAVMPEAAVEKALKGRNFSNELIVVAIGKAAWSMANAAHNALGDKIQKGIVLTKYNHSKGSIANFEIFEAGHPIPDENSILGTAKVLAYVSELTSKQEVIFLVSGGGSALFEKPLDGISLQDMMEVTEALLRSGADIVEINTIRKHLSAVKGGRFAKLCEPASIFAIVLSDVVGDRLDVIASGPACADMSTSDEVFEIIEKYNLNVSKSIREALKNETPKQITNCTTQITGSVSSLCEAVALEAKRLGYETNILSTTLTCEAREAGSFMASIAKEMNRSQSLKRPRAIIVGGEPVVTVKGNGLGGRNQELALAAAIGIDGLDCVLFSLGSDGTDGPTDAAGGMVDGQTVNRIKSCGINPSISLNNNDAYHALKASNDLIQTGATGTNVNDVVVLLF